jgi:tetratricopeptide (TPR) repeat protein
MANDIAKEPQATCFVVMGFGKKTDFETGRVLDLDKSYKNMIKPAVEAAGLICVRADEIVHSGLIDVPMYEQLLNADVVVADLSTSNKNAFYELGVRHALRPYTTVVVAEDGVKTFPFDISHVAVRQYHHLGEDIGFEEVMRFRDQLTKAIKEIYSANPPSQDSPVYAFLNQLTPPALTKKTATRTAKKQGAAAGTQADEELTTTPGSAAVAGTHSMLMLQVDEAQKKNDWITAKTLLTLVRNMMLEEINRKTEEMKKMQGEKDVPLVKLQEDSYLLQRLALATYKSKSPDEETALIEAHQLLGLLDPAVSNDPETLGLWGAIHKRLWELKKQIEFLSKAIETYKRGFYIKNDHYNGINYAYLLNIRAAEPTSPAEAIADYVEADRIRKQVLEICKALLANNYLREETVTASKIPGFHSYDSWYWVKATLGEAYAGLGDENKSSEILAEAYAKAPEEWMKQSTEKQLLALKEALKVSPLRFIKDDAKI